MRVLILNQYAPPDAAPTAKLVGELAEALAQEGHQVNVLGTGQSYRRIRSRKENRILRELTALTKLFLEGLRCRRPDIVLSTSSPPGLLILATFLSLLKRAKSVHWAMDLYPELAFALGKRWPAFLRAVLFWVTGECYRHATRVVTLDEDMRQCISARYGVQPEIIRPWLLHRDFPSKLDYPPKSEFKWLYSGNLGRAHEWKTLIEAQALLEERNLVIRLLFQGGGSEWAPAQELVKSLGLKHVEWLPYAPEERLIESLLAAHVIVATQKPVTRGLLWPSKLGLIMMLPRPIVFIGAKNGAIALELLSHYSSRTFAPGDAQSLADHIQETYWSWPPELVPVTRPTAEFSDAFALWKLVLESAIRLRINELPDRSSFPSR
jgi:colanic acid biosynthesis glycosyl transferase WcaI